MCRGWQLGGVLNGAEGMGWDEMRWDCACFGAAMCSAMAWGSGPSINPWVVGGQRLQRLQTLGEEACARDESLEGCWMVPKGWDEMRWDEMRLCLLWVQRCAVPWHGDVGPQLIHGWSGGQRPLDLISTGCRHWVKKHVQRMTAWRGAEWCQRDEMRWDCACFGAAMCSAMAWGRGPSINPWVVGGPETLGLISTGCRHWVKKHGSLEACWMVPKGWDEMRWDSSCFGAAMCSAMAWGRGPSINPWVVGGSETLGLISRGCRHWVKKHVQRMTAWRGAEWCRRDEMRWDEMRLCLLWCSDVQCHGMGTWALN